MINVAIPIPNECKSLVELCNIKNGILIVKDMNVPLFDTCQMFIGNRAYLVYRPILDMSTMNR